ncbi:unnamed protein product, partial [Brugia timori]|uniref:Arginine/serine-rich protein 1 n=1 Tax=Brugia timori TaxID=42155 RepID=A0A0R3QGQ8_9BILA
SSRSRSHSRHKHKRSRSRNHSKRRSRSRDRRHSRKRSHSRRSHSRSRKSQSRSRRRSRSRSRRSGSHSRQSRSRSKHKKRRDRTGSPPKGPEEQSENQENQVNTTTVGSAKLKTAQGVLPILARPEVVDKMKTEDEGAGAASEIGQPEKKPRKSRWSTNKSFVPGMPTILPSNLSDDQRQAYLRKNLYFLLMFFALCIKIGFKKSLKHFIMQGIVSINQVRNIFVFYCFNLS